jgi:hypothetical protein
MASTSPAWLYEKGKHYNRDDHQGRRKHTPHQLAVCPEHAALLNSVASAYGPCALAAHPLNAHLQIPKASTAPLLAPTATRSHLHHAPALASRRQHLPSSVGRLPCINHTTTPAGPHPYCPQPAPCFPQLPPRSISHEPADACCHLAV